MYYVCVENEKVVSVLSYEPQVPESVTVIEISDHDHELLKRKTHVFDIPTMQVVPMATHMMEIQAQQTKNIQHEHFLQSTDWKVLRHLREKLLNLPTSLTDEQLIELEAARQHHAAQIKRSKA